MKKLVEDAKKYDTIKIIKSDFQEPVQHEDGVWSVFTEIEIVFKNVKYMNSFCLEYMPSSIEVLEPSHPLGVQHTNDLLNDVLSKIHKISLELKNANARNKLIESNGFIIIRNFILYATEKQGKTIKELVKCTGIKEDKLNLFMDKLIIHKKIKEIDGKFYKS